ncbi:MAG TPA: carboxypeptidase-like regulatory domain-containing protein [Blastocatellia bacterium]|nr:carboxypeptidase-like regulatory domain-containing protein [Blastocatellia bacterium]
MKRLNGRNFWAVLCLYLLVCGGSSLSVSAQITRGSLSGNVTDPTGAVLADADVQLKNPANGEISKTTTDETGEFVFPSLAIGNYSLTVEAKGFKRFVIQNIVIEVATTARLAVALSVGEISEAITISNAQELVNTTSPSLTNIVERRQVQDLPLASRNPIELAKLQAGVAIPNGNDLSSAIISGLRPSTSNITHDGINVMDNYVKNFTFQNVTSPSVEATAEFAISTGTTPSDTGRGVGQVKIVTPSGTNQFHGGIFEFHRNAALNANNFMSNATNTPRPFQIMNRFGFTANGPVWLPKKVFGPASYDGRNRSFWFLSHEGFRQPFSAIRTRLVLTPEARQGLFRYQGADGQLKTVNLFTIGNLKTANSVTQALLAKTPLPNSTFSGDGLNTASYRYNVKALVNNSKWSGRFDQVLTEGSQLGAHKLEFVFHNTNYLTKPDLGNGREAPFPGGENGIVHATVKVPIVALHSTFGARATNEFRIGRQDSPIAFPPEKPQTQKYFVTLSSVTSPEIFLSDAPRNTTVSHWQDHVSFVKGAHTMRTGVESQSITWTDVWNGGVIPTVRLGSNAANPDGILNTVFPSLPTGATGTTIANRARAIYYDLTGALSSISQSFNVTSPTSGYVPSAPATNPIRQRDLGLYFQDQWRARRNMTLNFGVRWEFLGVPQVLNGLTLTPTNGIDGLFGISGRNNLFNTGVLKGAAPTLLDFGGADKGRPYYKNDWNNFAPFLGLAYSPRFAKGPLRWLFGEEGRSAMRGGFFHQLSARWIGRRALSSDHQRRAEYVRVFQYLAGRVAHRRTQFTRTTVQDADQRFGELPDQHG